MNGLGIFLFKQLHSKVETSAGIQLISRYYQPIGYRDWTAEI